MDNKLKEALDFSNYSATLNNQKQILTKKYQDDLVFYFNGGAFVATQDLFSFVVSLWTCGIDKTVIIDTNNTPVQIDNVSDFLDMVKNQYAFATNTYLDDFKTLTSKRSIQDLVNE